MATEPMNGIDRQDRGFLSFVKAHRSMGYGRMLQIVSHEWYRECKRRGDPVGGVLVANACLGFLTKKEQETFARFAESDMQEATDDH